MNSHNLAVRPVNIRLVVEGLRLVTEVADAAQSLKLQKARELLTAAVLSAVMGPDEPLGEAAEGPLTRAAKTMNVLASAVAVKGGEPPNLLGCSGVAWLPDVFGRPLDGVLFDPNYLEGARDFLIQAAKDHHEQQLKAELGLIEADYAAALATHSDRHGALDHLKAGSEGGAA